MITHPFNQVRHAAVFSPGKVTMAICLLDVFPKILRASVWTDKTIKQTYHI